jgi:hypothetical protein
MEESGEDEFVVLALRNSNCENYELREFRTQRNTEGNTKEHKGTQRNTEELGSKGLSNRNARK